MAVWLVCAFALGIVQAATASVEKASSNMASYDTIVIGMGAAGTTAASTLARAGKRVLGLDAMDRVGGRINTVPFGDGVVELGAEWIHGSDPSSVYDLAVQNNVDLIEQDISMEVFRSDGKREEPTLMNELLEYCLQVVDEPPEKPEPLGQHITRKLMAYIQEKHPSLLKDQDYINEFLAFMDLMVDNYEATDTWNHITTESRYEELGGHQHISWHKNGYKTLFEILLNTYKNGPGLPTLTIKLNKEVTQIIWPQNPAAKVVVRTKDGAEYTADNVIVTVSIGVLQERHTSLFSPQLPPAKVEAVTHLTMGLLGKVILLFPERWWPEGRSFFGFLWRAEDRRQMEEDCWTLRLQAGSNPAGCGKAFTIWTSGEVGRLTKARTIEQISIGVVDKIVLLFPHSWWPKKEAFYAFIWRGDDKKKVSPDDKWTTKIFGCSNPMGYSKALTLWTNGRIAKLVETLPEDVVKRKVMQIVRKFMGANVTIPEPTAILRSSWYSNPFTRGSYTYDNLETPLYPNARSDLAAPLTDSSGKPRVLFAGEATESVHFSTVHGAVDSGRREANRLLPSSNQCSCEKPIRKVVAQDQKRSRGAGAIAI